MKNYLMLLPFIFFFSCQQKENNKTAVPASDTIVTKEIQKETRQEENKQIGDTIFMKVADEKGLYVAEGSLDSIHSKKVYVKFKNEDPGELNGTIVPAAGKGNIRFNQIIFPDNSSDGPFGMDLKIQLKQKGNHILVIGSSLMADNPYQGKFTVQLGTKKE